MILTLRIEVPNHTVAEAVLAVVLADVEACAANTVDQAREAPNEAPNEAIDSTEVTGWDVLGLVWMGDLPGTVLEATMEDQNV